MPYDTQIDEPVKVWVLFDHGLYPLAMNWRGQLIKFEKLVFVGSKKVGDVKFLNLVCASATANFELEYNSSNHVWELKKVMPKE